MTGLPPTAAELHAHLAHVLDALAFPARRWQILATAEYYGADHATLVALHQLRAPQYRTLAEVVADIRGADTVRARLAGHDPGPGPGPAPGRRAPSVG